MARIEIGAARAVAVVVYAAAVATSVLAGPWVLMLFLPALIGSVVAARLVRRGVLEAPAVRKAGGACDNQACDQGAGGRRP
ncbi:hypothetical protein [Streptomyces sp. WZ.A104]|uniref:hypothetical protein n=1 Tax=Streptomyces sp. WZ.A104 TaxID=2023771 RepID=UPI0015C95D69|nr:hypothetical protein [Streptomyces sp. WZ.A104]